MKITPTRPQALPSHWLPFFLLVLACPPPSLTATTYSLRRTPSSTSPIRAQSVQLQLAIQGEMSMRSDDGAVNRQPVSVNGKYSYKEAIRLENGRSGTLRVLRQFQPPSVTMTVGKTQLVPQLPANRSTVLMSAAGDKLQVISSEGILSRQQRDLIRLPADSALLEMLLPGEPVEMDSRWKTEPALLARLTQLDQVHQSDVHGRLIAVEEGIAQIELSGSVRGQLEQAASSLQLKGNLQLRLADKWITSSHFVIHEKRAIGPAGPGLDVRAEVRSQIQPLPGPNGLPLALLETPAREIQLRADLLEFRPARSDFYLLHSPRWHVTVERPSLAVMRYVAGGRVLASCNVSRLPSQGTAPARLDRFKSDVQKVVASSLGQLVDASELATEGQVQVLRVVAAGVANEVPVQWIYYHLQDRQGRRVAISFSLATDDTEAFAGRDRTLVSSVRFEAPRTARQGKQEP